MSTVCDLPPAFSPLVTMLKNNRRAADAATARPTDWSSVDVRVLVDQEIDGCERIVAKDAMHAENTHRHRVEIDGGHPAEVMVVANPLALLLEVGTRSQPARCVMR
jgi:hypothetical protein